MNLPNSKELPDNYIYYIVINIKLQYVLASVKVQCNEYCILVLATTATYFKREHTARCDTHLCVTHKQDTSQTNPEF